MSAVVTEPDPPGVLLDHARDKIVLLDEDGDVAYSNAAVRDILGLDPEEFVGRNVFEFVHPEDVDEVRAAFERIINSESFTEGTVEYRFRDADGSWVWLESRMSNLTDDELDGYVVSSRDITDRVAAQREREALDTRLRELSATTSEVLWMFDADWSELLFVNTSYETVYGQPVSALEDDPLRFLEAVHPEDVPAVREAMEQLSTGHSIDIEYRVDPRSDYGTRVWVQADPIVEDGEVVRITGFTRDVTNRHRREQQLYVMDNLLRHNIRNDINVISGNAELIEEMAPEVADRAAAIRQTGNNLLRSAEKERDIIQLLIGGSAPERVDVVAAVERAVDTVRDHDPGADIEVSTSGTVFARVLPELDLAVVELIENAILHSESDTPRVSVTVETGSEQVSVLVDDEAPPIPEMEGAVLRGDHQMDGLYHSTGLGLWLVHWVVELSDGRIEQTRHEGGNRVRIELERRGE